MTDAPEEECEQLHNIWQRFLHYQYNDHDVVGTDWHIPPAMAHAASEIAAIFMTKQEYKALPETEDEFQDNWSAIVAFGDLMFNMGQFAYSNGVYRANMTPCKCLTVTDESIAAFFAGAEFGKDDN
jgi:hypothetical protein